MIILILFNALIFALFDYEDRSKTGLANHTLASFNVVFIAIYIVEAICKVIAMGFLLHPNSYLRNGWHLYDIFIIIVGILAAIPQLSENRLIHVLSVMRILKLAYTSTAMNSVMTPWMLSLKHMVDAAVMFVFVVLLFSIVGIHSFKGIYYYRCRMTPEPEDGIWEVDPKILRLCSAYGSGGFECPNNRTCGSPDMFGLSLEHEEIVDEFDLFYGTLDYNNVLGAFLFGIQIITFDAWADLMYKAEDANSSIFSRVYFPLLAFIGAYFCLNLVIAIVFETFQMFRELIAENSKQLKHASTTVLENTGKQRRDVIVIPHDQSSCQALSPLDLPPDDRKIPNFDVGAGSPRYDRGSGSIMIYSRRDSIFADDKRSVKSEKTGADKKPSTVWELIVSHPFYRPVIILLVIGNMLVISLNRYGISKAEARGIDIANTVFFCFFCIEMLISMAATGFNAYISEAPNAMDLITNILGIVETALTYSQASDGNIFADFLINIISLIRKMEGEIILYEK